MNPYDLVGKKLGDYRILRQIAVGGMAVIYLGEDVNLGRQAAIKVLTPELAAQDADLPMRFEREARAVAQMEHDNIIPIYQFGQQDGLYFLAMRYVDGQDLNALIEDYQREGKLLPTERALNILMQVAQALDYAHAQGIVHRDVKPSNVLLGPNDKVYLSDFGLVLRQSVDTTYGTAFGTPRYISPEQATDSQLATAASDIYSLAVMVYEIFTGERLFKGSSPMEVALSHITQPPLPPRAHNPDLPANAQQAILRSLEKDPARRHPTAQAFILDLKRAFEKEAEKSKQTQQKDSPKRDSTLPMSEKGVATATPVLINRNVLQERLKQTNTQPKPLLPLNSRNGMGVPQLIAVVGVVIMLAIGALLVLNSGPNPDVPPITVDITDNGAALATATSDNGAALATATPVPTLLHMRYAQEVFVLWNTSESARDLSALRFVHANGTESGIADIKTLEAGACLVVRTNAPVNAAQRRLPSDWGCNTSLNANTSATDVFWRAETANDDTFSLYEGGRLLVSCPTAGRSVSREEATCTLRP